MLSLSTIQKRNLNSSSDNDLDEALKNLSHVRLDRENISKIQNLECLTSVTNVYLQHNLIEVIENLKCLSSTLRFLTLAGNRISTVQGLKDLRVLGFLDLSDNFINEFDIDELPKSVSFILFKNNACAGKPDYRDKLTRNLPNLKSIDDKLIDDDDDDEPSTSDSESSDEDTKLEPDNEEDVADVCNAMLDRASSRLEMLKQEHREKIEEITKGQGDSATVLNNRQNASRDADAQLGKIETKMKDILDEIIEAERIALNSFDLPNPETYVFSQSSSANSSPRMLGFEGENTKEKENISNSAEKINASDSNFKSTFNQTFVSVGTTTGLSATPPMQEKVIRPRSKTKLLLNNASNKTKARTKQSGSNERILKQSKSAAKTVKSVTSNSLVRIPGARPFLKS